MKKIIILAIALLSTGIVFATTALTKHTDAKPAIVKVDANAAAGHGITNDAIATAD